MTVRHGYSRRRRTRTPGNDVAEQLDLLSRSLATMLAHNGRFEQILERRLKHMENRLEKSLTDLLERSLASLFGGTEAGAAIGRSLAGELVQAVIPGFAKGGIVDGPRLVALAGEAGPEAVLPLTRTSDGQLGVRVEWPQTQQMTRVDVQLKENAAGIAPADVFDDTEQQLLTARLAGALDEALEQAIATRLQEQLRDGGLLARYGSMS